VCFVGYVTHFMFTSCPQGCNCDDVHHPETRCCHHQDVCLTDDSESCSYQLCSSMCEQSADDSNDCHSGRNTSSQQPMCDDDGDLIVKRKSHKGCEVIYISKEIFCL